MATITAGDFRNGKTFEMDGKIMQVVEFQHVKPGKGAAFVRTKMKNIVTGAVTETSFNPTAKFEEAFVERKDMAYSYNDGDLYYFMDQETFDMVPLNMELLGVLFGMMRLNFWTYLSASWLSIAPGMVCLCILGNNLDFKSPVFWAMLALNLVLLLGSLWYTRHKLVQSSSRT